jgi:hypothetical protein
MNLTKVLKDFCNESDKTWKKEIKKEYRRWTDLPCSWIGRINIVKMTILQKASYILNPHQYSNDVHHRD